MYETNPTLKIVEQTIREQFPKYFGDGYRIDSIESSFFVRKGREVNYMRVFIESSGPPLDVGATSEFDLHIHLLLIDQNASISSWPAIAYLAKGGGLP